MSNAKKLTVGIDSAWQSLPANEWNEENARHLLNRAGWTATPERIKAAVSEEDLAEARRVLGKGVRIVTVASVEEALQVLEELGGSGLENATIDL